jgi:hypothetical protein
MTDVQVGQNWTYGIVAFLDILGFSELIKSDVKTTSPQNLQRLLDVLSAINEHVLGEGATLRAFSDSVVIHSPLACDKFVGLLDVVASLQRQSILRGVLVRGGIAIGKHFQNEQLVYSEALVRAYDLERKEARFPRVVVDRELLDWSLNDDAMNPDLLDASRALMLLDRDGQRFVNYLDGDTLSAHSELISTYKIDKVSASVLEKVQWLAIYHNHRAQVLNKPELTIQGALVDGFRQAV